MWKLSWLRDQAIHIHLAWNISQEWVYMDEMPRH
jgi:hypothetical protein